MLLLKCVYTGKTNLKANNYYAAVGHPTLPGWVVLASGEWLEDYYFKTVQISDRNCFPRIKVEVCFPIL